MSATSDITWAEANQRYLMAALAGVRACLEHGAAHPASSPESGSEWPADDSEMLPALEALCALFGLSPFERAVLLLCAGPELDPHFGALCARAQGDPQRAYPTFSLALAALPAADWGALGPAGALRRWRLIEVGAGTALTLSPLRIDERVLQFLLGVQHLDERLLGFVEPVPLPELLVPSQQALAERAALAWRQALARRHGGRSLPVLQLFGPAWSEAPALASVACALLGLDLYALPAQVLPSDPRELQALLRLWEREAALSGAALLLDCGELDPADQLRESLVSRLIEGIACPLIVAGRERRAARLRPLIALEARRPDSAEQRQLWRHTLGEAAELDGPIDRLVAQFSLSAPAIEAAATEALGRAAVSEEGQAAEVLSDGLWECSRAEARPRIEGLAQRITTAAAWDDLVLPEAQRQLLREIAIHVRQRLQVYERWGFAAKGGRGLGISALFAGPSGTGKTMAAEVLAGELRLDLYRIDLSQVVSKYIGETEKNLRKVFDAAEAGGAVLLFDEADALFGKRSEVKDSHDRYANIEISYLLQRMEDYRGLAILTTNMKDALDQAFLRRLRFVVEFPFPDAAQRAEIWRRIYPLATPTDGLAIERLARLSISGGTIRNIALYAAFLAAEEGAPVGMGHLLRATRVEYAKLERTLGEAEIGGWGG